MSTAAATTPLTIWFNGKFSEPAMTKLLTGLGPHTLVTASATSPSNLDGGTHDTALDEADIAFGQPDPVQILSTPRLKWVQLTTAGYTRYDNDAIREAFLRRSAIMTNSSSVYDEPCAEHVLAMILALARRLPQALMDQAGPRSWNYLPLRAESRLLQGQTVIIYGFGAIARRLVELLTPFGMSLIGVRRAPRGDEPIRIVRESEADAVLPTADHVVNLLPASDETEHYFNATRIERMKDSAIYYSVGRGSTTDQHSLQVALQTNKLAAAYLDVTSPEPLPPEHALWTTPNCFITPHTAGGHVNEYERLVEHFLGNLRRLEQGEPLVNRII
jgi:phosphoglycerate dehydrogenase-like enzyme